MKFNILCFLGLLLVGFTSCQSNDAEVNEADLIGQWFRSAPVKVYIGPNVEPEERGDQQFIVSFFEDGTFEYRATTFGVYAGTTLDDLNGYSIDHGVYTVDGNNLEIDLTSRTFFDTFYPDMMEVQTTEYTSGYRWKYLDATYSIDGDRLTFIHFTETDMIDPESETPGLFRNEENFVKI